ncbi:hypothetical protein P4204_12485 [Pseudomonas aeruginosa]|nr:hypothetical protein [Pseudomonas aeruginosa]
MSIELRGGVRASAVIGDSALRPRGRAFPAGHSRAVSAFDIGEGPPGRGGRPRRRAVHRFRPGPDPWLVAGTGLAAAPRLAPPSRTDRVGAPSRPLPRAPWPLLDACPTGAPAYIW